ncbi:MAG TPA: aspartate-semialdehyde dehydrogenase [Thermoanaerobaculia bacterium]|jgi:aspartate-semialdehyde dehydrogenase|nr:aspartate-semialdehyde dehydrogenase [Thermoanaerobaculia bacterium]
MPHRERRTPVAILGATGAVGQRLVQALERHPWFIFAEAVASERSAGKAYGEACHWLLDSPLPAAAAALTVLPPGVSLTAKLVLSALDATTAAELEPLYAGRGHVVVSNASKFRMDPRVPLLVPEINAHAAERVREQPWAAAGGGLVTNPNCSVVGIVMALAPLHQAFGLEAVTAVTMQAVSGAGYPGVPSLDIIGNVIPTIGGEEEKIAREPQKILEAEFPLSVAVNRVPVIDGHTVSMFVRLREEAGLEEIARCMDEFTGEPQRLLLPSAPARPLQVLAAADRPQPLRDVRAGDGMTVSVGNLRADPVYHARFTVLVHNTVRGAAGAALLNAELLAAKGLLAARAEAVAEAR